MFPRVVRNIENRRVCRARRTARTSEPITRMAAPTVNTSKTANGITFEIVVITFWIRGYTPVAYQRSTNEGLTGTKAHSNAAMTMATLVRTSRLYGVYNSPHVGSRRADPRPPGLDADRPRRRGAARRRSVRPHLGTRGVACFRVHRRRRGHAHTT